MRERRRQRQARGMEQAHQAGTRLATAAAAGLILAAGSVACADAIIGDWEDTTDGWIDWGGGQAPIAEPKFTYDTIGVTSGNKSLKLTQVGWGQNLSLKLQLFSNGVKEYRPDFFANTQFSFDLTLPAKTTAGWSEIYALAINAQNHGFVNESPIPKLHIDYGAGGGAQQTTTVTFDYSRLVDGDTSNGEIAPSAGWVEFILATNSIADAPEHGVFYFDKARLTSPNLRVDLNGGGAGTLHPNQAGFNSWETLPTSGQNGNPAQNGYPTAGATQSFTSFAQASGAVQTTLTSVDVGGAPGSPTYVVGATPEDGPKLNARDMSIPGRDFDNSGNFTPKNDNLYRDHVIAEAGTATSSNGTNHRMEIKFEGLDPNTPYKVKFYAYDNANPQGVAVFTDVTAQPLINMPSGQSADGLFTPGDGSAGTQYAPNGQYIDGSAMPTFPVGDEFRAIELYATSDGAGTLVFAETTVAGLSGQSQVLPVLNGYEIQKDQRSWLSTAGANWNDPANWSGGAIANRKGQVANFGNTSGTSITLDAPITVARLNFSGSAIDIGGGGNTLTLDDTSINSTLSGGVVTGRTEINLTSTSGHQTISAPLVLAKDTQVWTATAAQTVTLSNLQPSAVTLTKVGDGTLEVNNVRTNGLRVNAGTVVVLPDGTSAGASNVGSLSIAAGAKLDLKNNKLVTNTPVGAFSGGAYTGVHGEVARAYHSGAWDQPGLSTSMPDAGPTVGTTTIGVASASQVLFIAPTATGTFAGQQVTGASTIAMYTYAGDLNFDGRVDAQDYGIIDNWVQFPGTNGYANGDINYDGVIDAADYGIIDNTIQLQGPPIPTNGGGGAGSTGLTAVPEPAGAMVIVMGAATMLGRRGRRRR